jgi:hypothetical protein
MPSTNLTHDSLNSQSGVNLKWTNTDLGAVREVTLVYFKNTPDSTIYSVDVAPSALKLNLKTGFDSGASYQFQLQVTDVNAVTIYSNSVTISTPYFLVAPVISTTNGFDASVKVQLASTTNSITNNGGDSVEFVIKRQSDNTLFWIVMPYVSNGLYLLAHGSLVNQDVYTIACMFQPSSTNTNYSSPSAMSNSMTGTPSNIPNQAGNVTGLSVGQISYDAKFQWTRPSDFNEWSDNFNIHLILTNSMGVETDLDLATNLDVIEYTFTSLEAGFTYKCSVHYHNGFGDGVNKVSNFISLYKKPSAPIFNSIDPTDTAVFVSWQYDADMGQAYLQKYNIYDQNDILIHTGTNIMSFGNNYRQTGLTNGISYSYKISVENMIGESEKTTIHSDTPYGEMSIVSCVPSGKTLVLTITPNGKPVERVIMLGIDSTPTEELVANSIFDIPQAQISQAITGNITVTKTFNGLSGDLSFYLAVAHDNSIVKFIKSP